MIAKASTVVEEKIWFMKEYNQACFKEELSELVKNEKLTDEESKDLL